MKDFYVFVESLEYIEEHLCSEIDQEKIALHCGCSLSALQKTWKYCTHQGVMSYVKKRRLTLAARDISGGAAILDTALKYGYGSNEAFTRAFRTLWGISPSDFAKIRNFTDIYPRLNDEYITGGILMNRVKFDLTELYDRLQDKKGTYIVCFDIKNLDRINNELGRNMGDEVIRTCVERIDRKLENDMFVFRIGGDEFAVVTGYKDIEQTRQFEQAVTADNGKIAECGGVTAPVYLDSGIMLYDGSDKDFYDQFDRSVVRK
jgi:AraC family transcriptional regulator